MYRDKLNKYFDFRIYLDVDEEKICERAIIRSPDMEPDKILAKYERKYLQIQRWYKETYKPIEFSDIVIDNNDYENPIMLRIKT